MSTIESMESSKVLTVAGPMDGGVFLIIAGPVGAGHAGADGRQMAIRVSAADLLAAIEAEGIGVVVEGTLPEVTVEGDRVFIDGEPWEQVAHLRATRDVRAANLHRDIAILRWIDANPPAPEVDEADVEWVADGITNAYGFGKDARAAAHIARFLLASGRVTVTR